MDIDKQIIEEVRHHQCLFNIKDVGYKNLSMKKTLWQEIGERFNLSGEQCKKRWTGLRDCYKRCKRRETLPSGSAAPQSKRKWKFYDIMSFLDGIESSRRTGGTTPHPGNTTEFLNSAPMEDFLKMDTTTSIPQSSPQSKKLLINTQDNKFSEYEFFEMTAASIQDTSSRMNTQDTTELHFVSLAKTMKDAGLSKEKILSVEAKVSALVFTEIQKWLNSRK